MPTVKAIPQPLIEECSDGKVGASEHVFNRRALHSPGASMILMEEGEVCNA
jgi:hypothetical protein